MSDLLAVGQAVDSRCQQPRADSRTHGSARWEFEQRLTNDDDSAAGNDLHDILDGVLDLYRAGSAHTVVKIRRSYLVGDQAWGVDEFLWDNAGLLIGELEADSQAGISHITRPEWAVREVTLDPQYDNMQLAYWPYTHGQGMIDEDVPCRVSCAAR